MNTILIADDNPASRELLRDSLESIGLDIIEACNGEEALKAICEIRPPIALLDIQMPIIDGFGVVMALRALEAPPDTYLVALTALAMDTDRARILAAGFDQYMAKPISVSGIRTLVRDILAARRGHGKAS